MTIVEDRPAGDSNAARKAMIDSQLRTSGISAPYVLSRMMQVAREDHVPPSARGFAYIDRAIALGGGRYLAAPEVHGAMLQEARPEAADRVLLVDGGSGYLAALVRPLVGSLDVVEPEAALKDTRKAGAYSLLLIDGAVEHIPDVLARRLAEDARVVCGLAESGGVTRLAAGRKVAGAVALLPVAEMGIPVLPEFAAPRSWTF